jgi:hypothetical protein
LPPEAVLPFERNDSGRLSTAQRNEARIFALSIARNPEYRRNLTLAAIKRELAPAVELAVLAYAYGKPPDRVELGGPGAFGGYEDLPPEALAERAEHLAKVLRMAPRAEPPPQEEVAQAEASTDSELARLAEEARVRSIVRSLVTKEEIGA